MKIQSLSVVVPAKNCINNCKFCVSRMHCEDYKNMMDENLPFYDLYEKDYMRRLEFARDNGCNTVMLTGNSEPQQNKLFLQRFGTMNSNLSKPFRWIEMQTTGVLLDEPYLRFLRNHVGVSTISVSISSFDPTVNAEYNGTKPDLYVNIEDLCVKIKKYDFNLRISVNLTDWFDGIATSPVSFFQKCKKTFKADQVTLRVLYADNSNSPQSNWVKEHTTCPETVYALREYIAQHGAALEKLEYGRTKMSVCGMSTVLDDDCMSKEAKEELKYLILRPNCKLYSKWDDEASLIF